jgi:RND family efflux transporter MFP subunit
MIFHKRWIQGIVLVFLMGLFVFLVSKNGKRASVSSSLLELDKISDNQREETRFSVKVAPVEKKDLVIKLTSYGRSVALRKIKIKAEVSGVIVFMSVEESEDVEQGRILVSLDDRAYSLEVERYEAERLKFLSELLLEKKFDLPSLSPEPLDENWGGLFEDPKAQKNYQEEKESKQELRNTGLESEIALIESGLMRDQVMAATKNLTQAEINLKKARMNLEKTQIRAPFSGVITDIKVSCREHVVAGQELFTLVDVSSILVHSRILENEIGKIDVGQEVDLRFLAYPEVLYSGKVKAISPVMDPEDRTCKVIIGVTSSSKEIKPGMHAEVAIVSEVHPMKLLIPDDAILVRSDRTMVFVVKDGLAKWRYVKLGSENEHYVEILDGAQEGDQVIVRGHYTLGHDAAVHIVK